MRNTFGRAIVLSGGLLALLTATSASDPPHPGSPILDAPHPKPAPVDPVLWRSTPPPQPIAPPKPLNSAAQLKADIEALRAERKDSTAGSGADPTTERERLQTRLNELIKRLNEQSHSPDPLSKPMTAPPPKVVPKPDAADRPKPVDGLQAAINLFRGNDVDGTLRTLRDLDPTKLSREDRAYAQYLQGCCLRRTNRLTEATALFREIANARDDEFVAEAAITQLALMKSTQELELVLGQLRAKPKTR